MAQGVTARAADALLDRVLQGTFAPGEPMPSESELAGELGVSRLTVREAIKSLAGTRVLTVRQGRPSVVNPMDQWSPLDPRVFAARVARGGDALPTQLLEAREVIEGEIVALAAKRRTAEQLSAIAAATAAIAAAEDGDDVDVYFAALLECCDLVVEAAANDYLAALRQPLVDLASPAARTALRDPRRRRRMTVAFETQLAALRDGDAERARATMADHLGRVNVDKAWHDGLAAY